MWFALDAIHTFGRVVNTEHVLAAMRSEPNPGDFADEKRTPPTSV